MRRKDVQRVVPEVCDGKQAGVTDDAEALKREAALLRHRYVVAPAWVVSASMLSIDPRANPGMHSDCML